MADVRGNPWDYDPGPPSGVGGRSCSRRRRTIAGWAWRSSGARRSAGTTGRCSIAAASTGRRGCCSSGRRARRTSRSSTARSPAGRVPGCSTARLPRHRPLLPVPQHVRLPDLRSVHARPRGRWRRTRCRRSSSIGTRCSTRPSSTAMSGWSSRSARRPRSRSAPGSRRTAARPSPTSCIPRPAAACAGVRVIGVLHPGSAASAARRRRSRRTSSGDRADPRLDRRRRRLAARRRRDDPRPDRDVPVLATGDPFRDFPFGTCPRLGRGATSCNRSDNQRSIQLFSATASTTRSGAVAERPLDRRRQRADGYADDPGDLPYEPPRQFPRRFDPGPPATLARCCWAAARLRAGRISPPSG